ncbi:MAG: outer membrane beta-barrel protein [Gemmatimonadetes bacterium]|nr:outer membrane beta-barrel protein [Gemmatimonadota bacterium]
MRRSLILVVAVLFAVPAVARAQWGYGWLGAAASIPTGDAADALETGFLGIVGVGINVKSMKGVSVQGEGLFGSRGDGSSTLAGFLGNLAYEWNAEAKLHPYVFAGVGVLVSKPKGGSSNSEGAYQAGGGFSYMAQPKLNIWADVRYLGSGSDATKMNLRAIAAGISMPFGTGGM